MAAQDQTKDWRSELTSLNDRLTAFATRFEEKAKRKAGKAPGSSLEIVLENLRDLFTRDVTREGLSDLIRRDTRETLSFFTQEIDFEEMRPLPWHKRYPLAAWKIFLAFAYRLSPPRRIAFAVATFSLLIGLVESLAYFRMGSEREGQAIYINAGSPWFLIACTLFMCLLLMELRDKLDLKGDLEIAREIQSGLVPSRPFAKGSVSIHFFMRPANTVGGDYHDVIELSPDQVAVVIGDVSGKGMPAALLMALLQGSLRTLITAGLRGVELVSKLNTYLVESIPANRLVTLFYAELNTLTGEIRYVNAGHNPPFLSRCDGGMQRLDPTAMVLGVDKGAELEAGVVTLLPGERLMLFTDGVTEAFNDKDEEYGDDRLAEYLLTHAALGQEALLCELVKDVITFCNTSRPTDDITLVSISRSNSAGG